MRNGHGRGAGRLLMVAIWLARAAAATAGDASPATAVADAEVMARFVARPDEPTREFRARRRLEVSSDGLGKSAWMEVRVVVDAVAGFRYEVLAAGGSPMLQDKILHKVLRAEQEVYASRDNAGTALTADNYVFSPGGRDGEGRVRLLATARRKEVGLLNGEFLVTDDADLVEVSGTMAKGPSFWIPRIEMTKRYARVHGHRVNVRVDSTSYVRFLGPSRFTMTTEYESIDGDVVDAAADAATGTR